MVEHPRLYGMLLYVEQPFPYELDEHPLDVHAVAARKPFYGRERPRLAPRAPGPGAGLDGVALKTCKTQTGALLSLCWARAHGMTLMVQDLTNPMLAQVPHVLLAAYAGTIMGVETNAMQFYPAASLLEAEHHPGLYTRRQGTLDLSTVRGAGFGYAGASAPPLPPPEPSDPRRGVSSPAERRAPWRRALGREGPQVPVIGFGGLAHRRGHGGRRRGRRRPHPAPCP